MSKKWRVYWVEKATYEFPHTVIAEDAEEAITMVMLDSRAHTLKPKEVETEETFAEEQV